jgi:drug/metabolite transporter (DMT)-like permease
VPRVELSSHSRAVLQALFVTFLWSTSWVLIKVGFRDDLPPLLFAGLRYTAAFICLFTFMMTRRANRAEVSTLKRRDWLMLALLGVLFYAVTQASQFVGLKYLPSATVNLLLTFSSVVVAWLGIYLLKEKPLPIQWLGVGIYLTGVMVYFYPFDSIGDSIIGISIVLLGVLTNAVATILGRSINRQSRLSPLVVTVISMGIGAAILLVAGVLTSGIPQLSALSWAIILWLAVMNTAFAFTLWNRSLQHLAALESSIINNAMMIQIPLLAWVFLGEDLTGQAIVGLFLAGAGILIVQLRRIPLAARFTLVPMRRKLNVE